MYSWHAAFWRSDATPVFQSMIVMVMGSSAIAGIEPSISTTSVTTSDRDSSFRIFI